MATSKYRCDDDDDGLRNFILSRKTFRLIMDSYKTNCDWVMRKLCFFLVLHFNFLPAVKFVYVKPGSSYGYLST